MLIIKTFRWTVRILQNAIVKAYKAKDRQEQAALKVAAQAKTAADKAKAEALELRLLSIKLSTLG